MAAACFPLSLTAIARGPRLPIPTRPLQPPPTGRVLARSHLYDAQLCGSTRRVAAAGGVTMTDRGVRSSSSRATEMNRHASGGRPGRRRAFEWVGRGCATGRVARGTSGTEDAEVAAAGASGASAPHASVGEHEEEVEEGEEEMSSRATFEDLGLPKKLCAALESVGFSEPSPPQVRVVGRGDDGPDAVLRAPFLFHRRVATHF